MKLKQTMIAAAAIALSTCAVANSADVLYIAHGKTGVYTANTKKADTLTLQNAHVSYFFNRPIRKAGKVNVKAFVKKWNEGKDSFKNVPPNADLVVDRHGVTHNQFVTLSNPTFNSKTHDLSFNIKAINSPMELKSGSYNNVILFIDDLGCSRSSFGGCA